MEEQTPNKLRYFVAKFGLKYYFEHPVEGGCYPLPPKYWPSNFVPYNSIREGDIVLLFCFGNYRGHKGEIPAIGVVYRVDEGDNENTLWCHYISLSPPINSSTIHARLAHGRLQEDLHGILEAGRSPYRFLFMIQSESGRALLVGCQINWP